MWNNQRDSNGASSRRQMKTKERGHIDILNLKLQSNIELLMKGLGIDLEDYVVTETEIRGVALCHDSADNSTGFTYYKNNGIWFCWTQRCHDDWGQDSLGLIRAIKQCSFPEAIKYAERFTKDKKVDETLQDRKIEKEFRRIDNWKKHLTQKVYEEDILKRLGSANGYAKQRNIREDLFEEMGAGYAREGTMKHRIVFPVRDIKGRIIGFTGRRLYDTNEWKNFPKWKHHGFEKGINLFNIHRAKKYIRDKHQVILCEGPFDMMRFEEAGFHNVVSIFGTHITQGQITLLCQSLVMDVVLALDHDDAAIKTLGKNVSILHSNLFNVEIIYAKRGGDWADMSVEEIREIMESL